MADMLGKGRGDDEKQAIEILYSVVAATVSSFIPAGDSTIYIVNVGPVATYRGQFGLYIC